MRGSLRGREERACRKGVRWRMRGIRLRRRRSLLPRVAPTTLPRLRPARPPRQEGQLPLVALNSSQLRLPPPLPPPLDRLSTSHRMPLPPRPFPPSSVASLGTAPPPRPRHRTATRSRQQATTYIASSRTSQATAAAPPRLSSLRMASSLGRRSPLPPVPTSALPPTTPITVSAEPRTLLVDRPTAMAAEAAAEASPLDLE